MENNESNIIIYNTIDGKASVVLYAHDGSVWMKNAINRSLWDKNQNQLAELFDTSKQTISYHVLNILNERELSADSVVKDYLTTASDGKTYLTQFYKLDAIISVGYRVNSIRATQGSRCRRGRTNRPGTAGDRREDRGSREAVAELSHSHK